jgi:hypothetical protein
LNRSKSLLERPLTLLGILSSTQFVAQIIASLVRPNDARFAALLGVAVFLATTIAYVLWSRRPGIRAPLTSAMPYPFVVGLVSGTLSTALLIWGSIALQRAARVEARTLTFHMTFLALAPYDSSRAPFRWANVPTNTERTQWERIPVFQEASYLLDYDLDWHVNGQFVHSTSCSGGAVVPTIIVPRDGIPRAATVESSIPGQTTVAWTESLDVGRIREILIEHHHFNCFFQDEHHTGTTMRIPVRRLHVVVDCSLIDRAVAFEAGYVPRIVVKRRPYLPEEDITDRARWGEGILTGDARNLQPNDEVWFMCRYAYEDPRLRLLRGKSVGG